MAKFNVNRTVTIEVETDAGARVHNMFAIINGTHKIVEDVVSETRASNIKSAINFLLKDKSAKEAITAEGLTVGRGSATC